MTIHILKIFIHCLPDMILQTPRTVDGLFLCARLLLGIHKGHPAAIHALARVCPARTGARLPRPELIPQVTGHSGKMIVSRKK